MTSSAGALPMTAVSARRSGSPRSSRRTGSRNDAPRPSRQRRARACPAQVPGAALPDRQEHRPQDRPPGRAAAWRDGAGDRPGAGDPDGCAAGQLRARGRRGTGRRPLRAPPRDAETPVELPPGRGRRADVRLRAGAEPVSGGGQPAVLRLDAAAVPPAGGSAAHRPRSEEHTSELQSLAYLVCRLLLEKKKKKTIQDSTNRTKN